MEELSLAALARMVSEDFARATRDLLSDEQLRDLSHRIETGLRTAVTHQRDTFVAQCDARVELWTRTEARAGTPPSLRFEARARSNEAAHLADLFRGGADC